MFPHNDHMFQWCSFPFARSNKAFRFPPEFAFVSMMDNSDFGPVTWLWLKWIKHPEKEEHRHLFSHCFTFSIKRIHVQSISIHFIFIFISWNYGNVWHSRINLQILQIKAWSKTKIKFQTAYSSTFRRTLCANMSPLRVDRIWIRAVVTREISLLCLNCWTLRQSSNDDYSCCAVHIMLLLARKHETYRLLFAKSFEEVWIHDIIDYNLMMIYWYTMAFGNTKSLLLWYDLFNEVFNGWWRCSCWTIQTQIHIQRGVHVTDKLFCSFSHQQVMNATE